MDSTWYETSNGISLGPYTVLKNTENEFEMSGLKCVSCLCGLGLPVTGMSRAPCTAQVCLLASEAVFPDFGAEGMVLGGLQN